MLIYIFIISILYFIYILYVLYIIYYINNTKIIINKLNIQYC